MLKDLLRRRDAGELQDKEIDFDRIDRRAYIFPSLTDQHIVLFTLSQRFLNGGQITHVGIGSTQYEWFADHDYHFTIQAVQPIGYQLSNNQDDAGAATADIASYTDRQVGTIDDPRPVRVVLKPGYVWRIFVRARAGVPATGFKVVNLRVRTIGVFFR